MEMQLLPDRQHQEETLALPIEIRVAIMLLLQERTAQRVLLQELLITVMQEQLAMRIAHNLPLLREDTQDY